MRPDGELLVTSDDQYADPRTGKASGRAHVTQWDGDVRHRAGALTGTSDTASQGEPEAAGTEPYGCGTPRPGSRSGRTCPRPATGSAALAFSEDGRTVYADAPDVRLQRFPIAPGQAVRTICARTAGGLTEAQWRTYVRDAPYENVCAKSG